MVDCPAVATPLFGSALEASSLGFAAVLQVTVRSSLSRRYWVCSLVIDETGSDSFAYILRRCTSERKGSSANGVA